MYKKNIINNIMTHEFGNKWFLIWKFIERLLCLRISLLICMFCLKSDFTKHTHFVYDFKVHKKFFLLFINLFFLSNIWLKFHNLSETLQVINFLKIKFLLKSPIISKVTIGHFYLQELLTLSKPWLMFLWIIFVHVL